jgi:hypothetical protein
MDKVKDAPHVRVVGKGIDIFINMEDQNDADIAHRAIDLAFGRHSIGLDLASVINNQVMVD